MSFVLEAIERPDGGWECRWAGLQYGLEPDETSALKRLYAMASNMALRGKDAACLVHRLDGTIERRMA